LVTTRNWSRWMRPRPTPGQELLISEARTVLGRQKVIEGQAENVVEIE